MEEEGEVKYTGRPRVIFSLLPEAPPRLGLGSVDVLGKDLGAGERLTRVWTSWLKVAEMLRLVRARDVR